MRETTAGMRSERQVLPKVSTLKVSESSETCNIFIVARVFLFNL